MESHQIFYYPYGSFRDTQAPLLKAAALYFDRLSILDPEKASGGGIGAVEVAADVKLLEQEGVLVRIAPEEVLQKYEGAIAAAVRADLEDSEFVQLCEASGKAKSWTLALAKVPREIRENPAHQDYLRREPEDQAMQRLMGELPRSLAGSLAQQRFREAYGDPEVYDETDTDAIISQHSKFVRYRESEEARLASEMKVYDETQPGEGEIIEYRYADYPLALGESIMINHALFAGLLHAGAAPLTDDPFHNQVLKLKMKRAQQIPEVRQILQDRAKQRSLKQSLLAAGALTDRDITLPAISSRIPLPDILEYRHQHRSELEQARGRLAQLARKIRETPWTDEFEAELDAEAIPGVIEDINACRKARDAWANARGSLLLKSLGFVATGAAATLTLMFSATPLLPVAVSIGLLGMIGSSIIPGFGAIADWKSGKKTTENGLHYLLRAG
ncbi:MAG TPA: hypothetical protein VMT20_13200 [Terriglobia bacterium]|nr:hypothetical protein [Terriglobia bacterium]